LPGVTLHRGLFQFKRYFEARVNLSPGMLNAVQQVVEIDPSQVQIRSVEKRSQAVGKFLSRCRMFAGGRSTILQHSGRFAQLSDHAIGQPLQRFLFAILPCLFIVEQSSTDVLQRD
jgi:hypothetical protein